MIFDHDEMEAILQRKGGDVGSAGRQRSEDEQSQKAKHRQPFLWDAGASR